MFRDFLETGPCRERKTAKHRENSWSEVEKSEPNDCTGERCGMLCQVLKVTILYMDAPLNTGPFMLSFLSVIGFLSKRDRKRET